MAEISNWIPAILVPVILGAIVYFSRDLIRSMVTASVQHSFDRKLETLRTELRQAEETFKSDLHSKEMQIAALRETALTGLANRRTALDKRRLEAVEKIWACVVSLGHLKLASNIMSVIDFEIATKEVSKNVNARKVFELFGKSIDLSKISAGGAETERPFVSSTVWALFSAYKSILYYAAMQMKSLEIGIDASKLLTNKNVDSLIKAVLPHYSDYLEKYGASGYQSLLGDVEQKLLDELKKMLEGTESDAADVAKAGQILRAAERVQAEMSSQSIPNS